MQSLKSYFELLAPTIGEVRTLDVPHNLFLIGSLLSRKPRNILEMGMGTGYLTWSIIQAIQYNGVGQLTSVDNWCDWGGAEPLGIDRIKAAGVNVVAPIDEREFLRTCPDNAYDFVISDADHRRSHQWTDEYLRITSHDGFLYFHDTNSPMFRNLYAIVETIQKLNLPHYHFTQNTRPDERCDRGFLFVINKKQQ